MVSILTCPSNSYFNPRSREGSDNSVKPFVIRIDSISIHAPARGATLFRNVMQLETQISIHAPARGATKQAAAPFRNCSYFNPRSREWSDGNDGTNGKDGKDFNPRSREWSDARGRGGGAAEGISIHAPASGATDIIGRDVRTVQFQSTLPRVERLSYTVS